MVTQQKCKGGGFHQPPHPPVSQWGYERVKYRRSSLKKNNNNKNYDTK